MPETKSYEVIAENVAAVKENMRLAGSCRIVEEGEKSFVGAYELLPISRWGV